MKDILIEGHRILTTDAIADAVLHYARALFDHRATDIVTFPSMHDGSLSQCSMLLGGTAPVAVVEAYMDLPITIHGAESARVEIERRADALR